MISIDEAKKLIRGNRLERETETVSLVDNTGNYLARQIAAPFDAPRFDNSAMDGFAVRWTDIEPAAAGKNVSLEIAGESKAGSPWEKNLDTGQAVQISTGALVPDGADTVVPIEHCETVGNRVTVRQARRKGNHIRRRGEEYRRGDNLLAAGSEMNPAMTGLLASIGYDNVEVYAPPRVALLVTGSELIQTGEKKLDKGQIYDSNRLMLHHYLKLAGAESVEVMKVKDDAAATEQAIRKARDKSDIIISTGGVSVGKHDHIPAAAQKIGFEPVFHRVAQKPGKPFFFATTDNTLYFGLPGNPVSAFMTFTWYVYPELRYYMGDGRPFDVNAAILTHEITNDRKRSMMMRMQIQDDGAPFKISSVTQLGSHMISALTHADGFIVVSDLTHLKRGQHVDFYRFP